MSNVQTYSIAASAPSAAAKNRRRVHIPDFLEPDCALRLSRALETFSRWNTVTRSGDRHLDLDAAGLEKLSPLEQVRFGNAVHVQAQAGFQYLFDNYPIYDAYHSGALANDELKALFEFLNSQAVIDFVRQVTGMADIAFADAQATRYRPGHFLTDHDDDVAGKNRRAAFVLSLTKDWKADWGGLLMFIGADGHVEEAFTPKFNALNIFTVPQHHCVSVVAPFAPTARYSVTGWFRAGADPKGISGAPESQP